MEAKLFRLSQRVGSLSVRATIPGVEVRVDGELIGLTPLEPLLLTDGKHRLEARQPDGLMRAMEVALRGGRSTDVEVEKMGQATGDAPLAAPPRLPPPPLPDALRQEIAKAHYATGTVYFRRNRFHEAVGQFLEAYRLSGRIDLVFNIAHAYEKVDDPGPRSPTTSSTCGPVPTPSRTRTCWRRSPAWSRAWPRSRSAAPSLARRCSSTAS
ncbi:MAG: PEGA domain-containing protein [Myxococcales bacterium]|nr:PEGA domain-containing protein [Myxococcales bacterium]